MVLRDFNYRKSLRTPSDNVQVLRTQLSQVAAVSHQHTQASKAGDHAVSSTLQYLFQEERIGFSRKPGGAVVTDERIGNARQVTTATRACLALFTNV